MQKRWIFVALFTLFLCYSFFVYTSGTAGRSMVNSDKAIAGKHLFQKYNCSACHQLYGLGGFLGPDLTTTMSQPGKGAAYARAILKSGTQRMPDFYLSEEEVDALVAYLDYIDATAVTYKANEQSH